MPLDKPPSGQPAADPDQPRIAPFWLRLLTLLGVGVALLSLLWGIPLLKSSRRGQNSPAATALAFLRALRDGNGKAAQALLVPRAQHFGVVQMVTSPVPYIDYEVGPGTELGGRAEVAITTFLRQEDEAYRRLPPVSREAAKQRLGSNTRVHLLLEYADGRWQVWGMKIRPLAGGAEVVMDFRQPSLLQALVPRPSAGEIKSFQTLAPVAGQAFQASWRTDRHVQNEPAEDVLKSLAQELQLQLIPFGLKPATLRKPVSLRLRGGSRLEAVEEVCRQAGLHPRYSGGQLILQEGARRWPAVAAGPFLIEVQEVREFTPLPTGVLQLHCIAVGLPGDALHPPPADQPLLQDFRVTAPDGQDLYHAGNQVYYPPLRQWPGPLSFQTVLEETRSVPLRNLLGGVEAIGSVRGRVVVTLGGTVTAVRFAKLADGVTQQSGGVRWTVREGPPTPPSAPGGRVLDFESQGVDVRSVRWMAYDRANEAVTATRQIHASPDVLRLVLPQGTTAVELKTVAAGEKVSYDFEFRDLPLRRVPNRLKPVQFPGHPAPVSLTFVEIVPAVGGMTSPTSARWRIRNHTQQDVESIQLKCTSFDAGGRPLEEVTHTHAVRNAAADVLQILVKGSAEAVLVLNHRRLQPGTTRIEAAITGVGFADGTTWTP